MTKKKMATLNLRIPEELREKVDAAAAELYCTSATFIRQAIAEKLKRSEWLDEKIEVSGQNSDDDLERAIQRILRSEPAPTAPVHGLPRTAFCSSGNKENG